VVSSHRRFLPPRFMAKTRNGAKAPDGGGKGSKGKKAEAAKKEAAIKEAAAAAAAAAAKTKKEAAALLAAAKAKEESDAAAALAAVKALEKAEAEAKAAKVAERLASIFAKTGKVPTAGEIMAALESCPCGAALDKDGKCTDKKCKKVGAGAKDDTAKAAKGKNKRKTQDEDVGDGDNDGNNENKIKKGDGDNDGGNIENKIKKAKKKKEEDSDSDSSDEEGEFYKGDGLMMSKLRAARKLKYSKRTEMAAAAAPKMQTTAVKELEMGSTSAAALAMGGALARELLSQIPDWDLWEADGPLAGIRRLHPEDPHAMAAAVGAWEDPRVTRWVAERAASAELVGGLDNSLFAAALLGRETGLALVSGAGRPRAVAWRCAPLTSYTAARVVALVDEAAEEATRMAAVGSAAGRTVAAAADMAHADVWGALGQCAPGDLASLGTRFAWFAAQVAHESANPVTVGAVAQVLLHGMLLGMGLPLAARKGDGPAPGAYLDALTARATARDLRLAGVTPGDVDITLRMLRWHTKRKGDGDSDDGGGGGGGGSAKGKKKKAKSARVPPLQTEAAEDEDGNEDAEATPAPKAGAAKAPSPKAGATRGGAPASDHPYYLDPSELRDAAGQERCRFFVKDGTCTRTPCRFSHLPAAKAGRRK